MIDATTVVEFWGACLGSAQLIKYGKTQNQPNPFKNSLKTTQNHRDPLTNE